MIHQNQEINLSNKKSLFNHNCRNYQNEKIVKNNFKYTKELESLGVEEINHST